MSFFGSQLVFQVKIKLERFFKDKGILGKQNKYAVSVKLTGDRHFNALQHLCGSLLDHGLVSGVKDDLLGANHLIVFSTDPKATIGLIESIAHERGLTTRCHKELINPIPPLFLDVWIRSYILVALRRSGCPLMERNNQNILVLDGLKAGVNRCVRLQKIEIVGRQGSLENYFVIMEYIPIVFDLNTLDQSISKDGSLATSLLTKEVQSLPGLGSCEVCSIHRIDKSGVPSPTKLQQFNLQHGHEVYLPRTANDFRDYWRNIHGIVLPDATIWFAKVAFRNNAKYSYPAQCIATKWMVNHRASRSMTADIQRLLTTKLSNQFPPQSVSLVTEEERDIQSSGKIFGVARNEQDNKKRRLTPP